MKAGVGSLAGLESLGSCDEQRATNDEQATVLIKFTSHSIDVAHADHPEWSACEPVLVTKYWSGEEAPEDRRCEVRALWTESHLLVRFVANQAEPLVVNPDPKLDVKTIGLWDRDVCEIFIAPDAAQPRRYFEFEVAPTGEWLDLGIHQLPETRETEWDFDSGMKAYGRIESSQTVSSVAIPWSAIGIKPSAGKVLKGNLLRCVGEGENRGYLAWIPTLTPAPNFHVPEAFGDFKLVF